MPSPFRSPSIFQGHLSPSPPERLATAISSAHTSLLSHRVASPFPKDDLQPPGILPGTKVLGKLRLTGPLQGFVWEAGPPSSASASHTSAHITSTRGLLKTHTGPIPTVSDSNAKDFAFLAGFQLML